tara:strand:- start:48 stop:644 length:597 start_codon:yes stop_codon:yes gene_type:complete
MAGYRRAGANSFTNATTFNDQIERQRDEYKAKNQARSVEENLGISRDTSALFPSFVAQEIYDRSVEEFQDLDIVSPGGNPDFASGGNLLDSRNFNLFGNVSSQIDKPNEKGPNLVAPDINNLSTPTPSQESSSFTNRGFGWSDGRNEPGTDTARIGEYFSKHYNSIGSAQASIVVPVLGEAKDQGTPAAPDAINYDQP